MSPRTPRRPEAPELVEQRAGVRWLRWCGFEVAELSQGYRAERGGTRQTPGLPDVYAMHPKGHACWWEAKSPEGRERESQIVFRENATACGVLVLTGPSLVVQEYLIRIGAARRVEAGFLCDPTWAKAWPEGFPRQFIDHRAQAHRASRPPALGPGRP